MRWILMTILLLALIAAPTWLLPRLPLAQSRDELLDAAAADLVATLPIMSPHKSIAVGAFENDLAGALHFALMHRLRRQGNLIVMDGSEIKAITRKGRTKSVGVKP